MPFGDDAELPQITEPSFLYGSTTTCQLNFKNSISKLPESASIHVQEY